MAWDCNCATHAQRKFHGWLQQLYEEELPNQEEKVKLLRTPDVACVVGLLRASGYALASVQVVQPTGGAGAGRRVTVACAASGLSVTLEAQAGSACRCPETIGAYASAGGLQSLFSIYEELNKQELGHSVLPNVPGDVSEAVGAVVRCAMRMLQEWPSTRSPPPLPPLPSGAARRRPSLSLPDVGEAPQSEALLAQTETVLQRAYDRTPSRGPLQTPITPVRVAPVPSPRPRSLSYGSPSRGRPLALPPPQLSPWRSDPQISLALCDLQPRNETSPKRVLALPLPAEAPPELSERPVPPPPARHLPLRSSQAPLVAPRQLLLYTLDEYLAQRRCKQDKQSMEISSNVKSYGTPDTLVATSSAAPEIVVEILPHSTETGSSENSVDLKVETGEFVTDASEFLKKANTVVNHVGHLINFVKMYQDTKCTTRSGPMEPLLKGTPKPRLKTKARISTTTRSSSSKVANSPGRPCDRASRNKNLHGKFTRMNSSRSSSPASTHSYVKPKTTNNVKKKLGTAAQVDAASQQPSNKKTSGPESSSTSRVKIGLQKLIVCGASGSLRVQSSRSQDPPEESKHQDPHDDARSKGAVPRKKTNYRTTETRL